MRILAALCLVSLLYSCNGGDDFVSKGTSDTTLDLEETTDSLCRAYYTSFYGINTRVYNIKPGTNVQRIVCREYEVWKSKGGTKCVYSVAFLKDKEPQVILVITSDQGNLVHCFFRFQKEDGWLTCCGRFNTKGWNSTSSYAKEIEELRVPTASVSEHSIDVSRERDNEHCKISYYDKYGPSSRFYASKNGHTAKEVKDENNKIWEATKDQACLLCEHHERGENAFLRLHIKRSDYKVIFRCFKLVDYEWKNITEKDFNEIYTLRKRKVLSKNSPVI
ncbi:signal peptide-containing protein [Theileria equi strain WA]|uniref:Signal peptide-containing protein n=1 Tax=Theileria equi strain WA TaxID=1537102 RepID=L0AXQ2_THEEQ|nr:signal peptide-containing protein [Theileria equi strain WA]AFZ80028.1 signal peptide-containing protein [Theileria equi strain WA]|eukprot:XP_004829694.1 signal peptide-containing protein [Theileria equi strain WA]